MNRQERTDREQRLAAALEQVRLTAHAEADAHFDAHALEAQRHKILQRLAHAGQPARVLPFPGHVSHAPLLPASRVNRRWLSIAAAAGLLVGILGGEVLHLMPANPTTGDTSSASRPTTVTAPVAQLAAVPAIVNVVADDDDFLWAVDSSVRSAAEFRALDDLTFAYEPR